MLGLGSWIGCPLGCITLIAAAQCDGTDGSMTLPHTPLRRSVIAGTARQKRDGRDTSLSDGMRKVEAD
jgi:hypothetical protein